MSWSPTQYERYRSERGRPFFELLARIPLEHLARAIDLGCGTGELTATLHERWPDARILGIDSSPEMIAAARPRAIPGRLDFEVADVSDAGGGPYDLMLSNATLHWVPDHARLIPKLAGLVGDGGALAVQVPGSFDSPSHVLLRETARDPRWADALAGTFLERPVLSPAGYAALLHGLGFTVDAWETTYLHVLSGADPVLEWTKGTALRPVLARLADPSEFLSVYAAKLRVAYPPSHRGTLFPFRRVFFVAKRG